MDSVNEGLIPVGFYQPYFYTTQGHKNILGMVTRLLHAVSPSVRVAPLFSDSSVARNQLKQLKPPLVIVDFPDAGHKDWITEMHAIIKEWNGELWYLAMYPRPIGIAVGYAEYDRVIGLEPDVGIEDGTGQYLFRPSHEVSPLIAKDKVVEPSPLDIQWWHQQQRNGGGRPITLVMQTGTADERKAITKYAHQIAVRNRCGVLVPSLECPQPATRFACLADIVVAAPGYSLTWELQALGVLSKVHWCAFRREVENCERRAKVAAKQSKRVQPGLGQDMLTSMIRMYLHEKGVLNYESAHRHLGGSAAVG